MHINYSFIGRIEAGHLCVAHVFVAYIQLGMAHVGHQFGNYIIQQ
jgi:hypothetical protein